jgi:SIR2-like domain
MEFEEYKDVIRQDAQEILKRTELQPIVFIGSGLSQRYFNGPNWEGLLGAMATKCPRIEREFAYYKQKHRSFPDIGAVFAEAYAEWAWDEGRNQFAADLFDASHNPSIYFKSVIADYFESILPLDTTGFPDKHLEEIEALKSMSPYTIITTNYDRFLEMLFPEYTPIIGQQVIYANYTSIGEILKIHGCSSSPKSIVITSEDYTEFMQKKKYLSAKLLTFFAEHTVIFLGYSASDTNVKAVLSDIAEMLHPNNELLSNVYLIEWDSNVESRKSFQFEKLISIEDNKSVRVKSILAGEFSWVFQAFESNTTIPKIRPDLLRALQSRVYQLVRRDIPKKTIEINFQTLERAVSSESEIAKLLGITTLDDPTKVNAMYPYLISHLAEHLGYKSWNHVDKLLKQIIAETGIDIKESDNRYHFAFKSNSTSKTHKYSDSTLELLGLVKDGKPYKVDLTFLTSGS